MNKKITRIIGYVLAIAIFAAGLCVYLFPFVNRAVTKNNIDDRLNSFRYIRVVDNGVKNDENSTENTTDNTVENNTENVTDSIQAPTIPYDKSEVDKHKYDLLYDALADYNQKIYANNQSGLQDAWSYEQAPFDLTKYGIYNNILAELRIPAMDCDVPLYLGATMNNMAWGAAQLGQTSMPIGGENTNCVIAAHRGCANGKFFLEIQNMKIGDRVYLDNLWETLTYEVTDIKVISPDEINKVLIQKGKDMVTLITCHPYPQNYQRYVVYCERTTNKASTQTPEEIVETDTTTEPTTEPQVLNVDNSSQAFIEVEKILVVAVPVFLLLLAFVLFVLRAKRKNKKKQYDIANNSCR